MLTNWNTVSQSIKTLQKLEEQLVDPDIQLSKKERLKIRRECEKLELSLGGIREMGNLPNLIVVFDTNKEKIAIQEATTLGIPVVAIVDSNSNPDNVDYPIPGNDDAIRAITLYCQLIANAALEGIESSMSKSSADICASAHGPKQMLPKQTKKETKKTEAKSEAKKEAKSKAEPKQDKAKDAAEPKAKDASKATKPAAKSTAKKAVTKDDKKETKAKSKTKEEK